MVHRLSIILLSLVLLAACGAPAAQPTPAANPTATASSAATVAFPVTITHAGVGLTLSQPATRIVVCSEEALDFLIVLEIQPVGYCSTRAAGATNGTPYNLPNFFPSAKIGTPTFVGNATAPSVELIATLKPDLIISTDYTEINEKLAQVAPTLALSVDDAGYWRETLRDIAKLVDRVPQAEQFLSEYDATLARLAQQTAPTVQASPRLLLVYSFGASDGTMLLGGDWFGSRPFTQLGFTLVEPDGVTLTNGVAPISPETVAQTAADIVFVLRPELPDGTRPSYPLDDLLASRTDTRVVYQVFGSTRASTAPWTDRFVLEEVAGLLSPVSGQSDSGAAFPVTIEHKYGSTTLAARPVRIVTVGLTDHDALLALGVAPVGVTEWFGAKPHATWEWAQDKLGDANPTIVGDASSINFEAIAALKPDAILALYSGLTKEQYDLLAKIAPTIAQPGAYVDYGIPWQELTLTVGSVVGQADQAAVLVRDVEARFAQVRSDHPEFAGATALVATPYEGIWVYGPEDVRGRLLTALGFALPQDLAEVTGTQFGGNLSMERADMLDVDALIWLDAEGASGPLGGPVYASLPVHTQGREVFLKSVDDPLGGATSFVSVLSLPFLIDELVPRLAAAVDGDPATPAQ